LWASSLRRRVAGGARIAAGIAAILSVYGLLTDRYAAVIGDAFFCVVFVVGVKLADRRSQRR